MGDNGATTLENGNTNELKNYTRGATTEMDQGFIIENLPENLIHVKVKRNGKMSNLLVFATKSLKDEANRNILFTGLGQSVSKTTWCAEMLRRKFKNCCQITRSHSKTIEEVWEPKLPELSQLKVTREIPYIEILVSKDDLDPETPGYIAPNTFDPSIEARKPPRRNLPRKLKLHKTSVGEDNASSLEQQPQTSSEGAQPQEGNKKNGPRRPRRGRKSSKDIPPGEQSETNEEAPTQARSRRFSRRKKVRENRANNSHPDSSGPDRKEETGSSVDSPQVEDSLPKIDSLKIAIEGANTQSAKTENVPKQSQKSVKTEENRPKDLQGSDKELTNSSPLIDSSKPETKPEPQKEDHKPLASNQKEASGSPAVGTSPATE